MCGECDRCGEHCLDCLCERVRPKYSEWISVEDRLPEENSSNIAVGQLYGKAELDRVTEMVIFTSSDWFTYNELTKSRRFDSGGHADLSPPLPIANWGFTITHWMPWPEVPDVQSKP